MTIEPVSAGLVQGMLHRPAECRGAIVLAHGAGSDCRSPLISALASAFAAEGLAALRIDLPFRQNRPKGPPPPGAGTYDREALLQAADLLRTLGPVAIGGHSYGGRQATMLAAESPDVAHRLLLLSYPLHPPRRPESPRTAHFPQLHTPSCFIHGTRDPFGSPAELQAAVSLVPGPCSVQLIDGAGHELKPVILHPEDVTSRFLSGFL